MSPLPIVVTVRLRSSFGEVVEGFACAKDSGASQRVTSNKGTISVSFTATVYSGNFPDLVLIDVSRPSHKCALSLRLCAG
jgi:hypothetical protein